MQYVHSNVLCAYKSLSFICAGVGISVTDSALSYSSQSLSNNSIILANSSYYGYSSTFRRMGFYCCSNSTSAGTGGTFIGLNNVAYSGRIRIFRYNSSHSSYAGCIYFYLDKRRYSYSQNYLETSEQGIHTCRLPDTTGRNVDVNVGIYRQGYSGKSKEILITHYSLVKHLHSSTIVNDCNSPFCIQLHQLLLVSNM